MSSLFCNHPLYKILFSKKDIQVKSEANYASKKNHGMFGWLEEFS